MPATRGAGVHRLRHGRISRPGSRRSPGAAGAQVVLDPVGGSYSEPALRGLGRGGSSSPWVMPPASIPAIPLNLVLLKGITVLGMEIRTFAADYPDADRAADDAELAPLFAEGTAASLHRRALPTGAGGHRAALRRRPQGDRQGRHRRRVKCTTRLVYEATSNWDGLRPST